MDSGAMETPQRPVATPRAESSARRRKQGSGGDGEFAPRFYPLPNKEPTPQGKVSEGVLSCSLFSLSLSLSV